MRYCDFCQAFYTGKKNTTGLKGKVSQHSIGEYFIRIALREKADRELTFSDDLFGKWYSGKREPAPELWALVEDNFNESDFAKQVSRDLNSASIEVVADKIGLNRAFGGELDFYAFCSALTAQFNALADGRGNSENVINRVYREQLSISEFPQYIQNSSNKYSKMKTLLYSSEERPFYEFFICNSISAGEGDFIFHYRHRRSKDIIEGVTLEKLNGISKYVILVGMGGIGKSMMMRHLLLSSIENYSKTGLIPVMVTLREFSAENNNLVDIIVESMHRFDTSISVSSVQKLLEQGRCQVLLDGLDEIKASDMGEFLKELDVTIDRYPDCQYVMSSRRNGTYIGLPRFMIMWMMPFTHSQALELIDKLEFCPEEPRLKSQFREKLEKDLFESHREFVTNPLLLTLMLMNYHRFADVPEKKYLFYDQAYQTLLQRHDADKLAYKRVFHSVNDPSEFTQVFREFCAKSYRKGDYEFDTNKFDSYFEKLRTVEKLNLDKLNSTNFLYDVCNSACLMYEESQSYHFLHRSFQEYFFADYYSRQEDSVLIRLGKTLDKTNRLFFDDSSAYEMLYELAPEKVEKFIFLPFLKEIYENRGDKDAYLFFLKSCYGRWIYTILNEEKLDGITEESIYGPRMNFAEPTSEILSWMAEATKTKVVFNVKLPKKDIAYKELISTPLYGIRLGRDEKSKIRLLPASYFKDFYNEETEKTRSVQQVVHDEGGNPVEFGHIYKFDFDLAIKTPEKYEALMEMWLDKSSAGYEVYGRVKSYYEMLNEKYDPETEIDDDF